MLGTDLDLDDAYDWAIDELAGIEREIAIECERILPGATFDAVRAHLNSDPAGLVLGVDPFRSALQDIVDAAIDGLVDVEFDIVAPLRRCVVGIQPGGRPARRTTCRRAKTRPARARRGSPVRR